MGNTRTFNNQPVRDGLVAGRQAASEELNDSDRLKIDGQPYSKFELVAHFNELLKTYLEADAAKVALQQKVAARDAGEPQAQAFLRAYAASVATEYGDSSAVRARFGIPEPKARRELSLEEKMQRAAKAQETRRLRGTQGRRQKQRLKAQGNFEVNVSSAPGAAASAGPASSTASAPPLPPLRSANGSGNGAANGSAAPASNGSEASGANGANLLAPGNPATLNGGAH